MAPSASTTLIRAICAARGPCRMCAWCTPIPIKIPISTASLMRISIDVHVRSKKKQDTYQMDHEVVELGQGRLSRSYIVSLHNAPDGTRMHNAIRTQLQTAASVWSVLPMVKDSVFKDVKQHVKNSVIREAADKDLLIFPIHPPNMSTATDVLKDPKRFLRCRMRIIHAIQHLQRALSTDTSTFALLDPTRIYVDESDSVYFAHPHCIVEAPNAFPITHLLTPEGDIPLVRYLYSAPLHRSMSDRLRAPLDQMVDRLDRIPASAFARFGIETLVNDSILVRRMPALTHNNTTLDQDAMHVFLREVCIAEQIASSRAAATGLVVRRVANHTLMRACCPGVEDSWLTSFVIVYDVAGLRMPTPVPKLSMNEASAVMQAIYVAGFRVYFPPSTKYTKTSDPKTSSLNIDQGRLSELVDRNVRVRVNPDRTFQVVWINTSSLYPIESSSSSIKIDLVQNMQFHQSSVMRTAFASTNMIDDFYAPKSAPQRPVAPVQVISRTKKANHLRVLSIEPAFESFRRSTNLPTGCEFESNSAAYIIQKHSQHYATFHADFGALTKTFNESIMQKYDNIDATRQRDMSPEQVASIVSEMYAFVRHCNEFAPKEINLTTMHAIVYDPHIALKTKKLRLLDMCVQPIRRRNARRFINMRASLTAWHTCLLHYLMNTPEAQGPLYNALGTAATRNVEPEALKHLKEIVHFVNRSRGEASNATIAQIAAEMTADVQPTRMRGGKTPRPISGLQGRVPAILPVSTRNALIEFGKQLNAEGEKQLGGSGSVNEVKAIFRTFREHYNRLDEDGLSDERRRLHHRLQVTKEVTLRALLTSPNTTWTYSVGIAAKRMAKFVENELTKSAYNTAVQNRAFQRMASKWTRSEATDTISAFIAGHDKAAANAQARQGVAVRKPQALKDESYQRFEAIRYRFKRLLMRLDKPTKDGVFGSI